MMKEREREGSPALHERATFRSPALACLPARAVR